jgi:hypothetical protein
MVTRRQPTGSEIRRKQMQAVANYPVDWLEERSGLVGGVKYFLFRKVPSDTNWMQTLRSATLTAFLVQAITGVILAMYYQPTPHDAYSSIQNITDNVTLGWLVRGVHKWARASSSSCSCMGRVFLFGAYKSARAQLDPRRAAARDGDVGVHRLPAPWDRLPTGRASSASANGQRRSSGMAPRSSYVAARRSEARRSPLLLLHMLVIQIAILR